MQKGSIHRAATAAAPLGALATAAALLGAGALGGCASPEVTPISIEGGEQGQLIDCAGFGLGTPDCVKKANAVCDGGYTLASTGQWHSGAVAGVLEGMDRGMIVRCQGGGSE